LKDVVRVRVREAVKKDDRDRKNDDVTNLVKKILNGMRGVKSLEKGNAKDRDLVTGINLSF
jgi:DNA-directed RNA polymerase beta' subunit